MSLWIEWVSKVKVTQISMLKLVFLKNSWAYEAKVHMKAYGRMGMKIYTNELSYKTNMAAMPIYGENLKKSSPEPLDWWPWNLVCSIVYTRPTKVVQIMTLSWPWPILREGQIWPPRLSYGRKWKLLTFFWNLLQPKVSSCLKNSTKWVNEVECVSKVKTILWPWSKVTQISNLKLVFRRNSWVIWNQSSYKSLS